MLLSVSAGGNLNSNQFSSPNTKKFRPSFEGESGPSQDERFSSSPQLEASKPSSPIRRQQQQQEPLRKPKREKTPAENNTRLA